ncbi:MAG: hypothetical protein ABIE84_00420 [bacterium]
MFKNWKLLLGILFVICHLSFVIAAPAVAYPEVFPAPTINGPTGVTRIPSANVIPYKNFNIAAALGTTNRLSSSEGTVYYNMNLGAFNGIELGIVGGTNLETKKMREGVFVNMKLSLSTGDEPFPMLLAIGVENMFSYDQTDVYMVATKYMHQGPKLTFGFMGDFPDNKFRALGMVGIEYAMSDNLILNTDMMVGESVSQLNGGAKLYLTPIFSVNLYGLNVLNGDQIKDERAILIGVSWANPF